MWSLNLPLKVILIPLSRKVKQIVLYTRQNKLVKVIHQTSRVSKFSCCCRIFGLLKSLKFIFSVSTIPLMETFENYIHRRQGQLKTTYIDDCRLFYDRVNFLNQNGGAYELEEFFS